MTTSTSPIPGYPYGPVYINGQRVVENPLDYVGRHRFYVEPIFDITDEVTVAPLGGERWVVGDDYQPRHEWSACDVQAPWGTER